VIAPAAERPVSGLLRSPALFFLVGSKICYPTLDDETVKDGAPRFVCLLAS
jgi:hypothetical protein